jgi:galactose mutarotase-like enzyme
MQKIENDFLVVQSKVEGAELTSIFNKKTNLEYLWQAGEEWPKHAPVLFPIVGQLKDNIYYFEDKQYSLDRHGFARTKTFNVNEQKENLIEYILTSDDEVTLKVYPFEFELMIRYELKGPSLKTIYIVKNKGKEEMLFSIGAHPAFKVPVSQNEKYEDCFLEFNQHEHASRWLLNNGLITDATIPFFENSKTFSLSHKLFYDDALVFKELESTEISLKSRKYEHGLHFQFSGFRYFGIWAAKNADFICLEPWHGIADSINSDQQLKNKEGINRLQPGKEFYCDFTIETF